MIPENGPPRRAYLAALRKERLNQAGRLLVDIVAELFVSHDAAGSTDERVKVEKAIGEVVGRIAAADKAAESAAIVEMKDQMLAREKQAGDLDKLH